MVSSNNAINNTVGASISGVTNTLTITNPSNTASSAARETIVVGGGTASDPTINWNVSGVTNWEAGIDNSDSDKWKLSQGTALGTNDTIVAFTGGSVLKPRQPAFLGILSGTDTNGTGDNSIYTLGSINPLSIAFDRSSSFTTAGVFTCPVAGIYQFMGMMDFSTASAAHTDGNYYLTVNGAPTYFLAQFNPFLVKNTGGGACFSVSFLAALNAGDTVEFQGQVGLGVKNVQTLAGASFFSGYLVC